MKLGIRANLGIQKRWGLLALVVSLLLVGGLCVALTSEEAATCGHARVPSDSKCTPADLPYALDFQVTDVPLSGGEVRFNLVIDVLVDIPRLTLEPTTYGNVELTTDLGPDLFDLSGGTTTEIAGVLNITGLGGGGLLLATRYYADSPCGEIPKESEEYGLFVLDDAVTVRTGQGSVLELQFVRIQDLLAAGTLTQEEADVAFDELLQAEGVSSSSSSSTTPEAPMAPQGGDVSISGQVQWTDTAGGTHAARLIEVKAYTGAVPSLNEVGSTTTSSSGDFSFSLPVGVLGASPRDITIRAFARNLATDVVNPTIAAPNTYFLQNVLASVADGASMTGVALTANNTANQDQSFSIADSMIVGSDYQNSVQGARPARITSNYPRQGAGTASFYSSSTGMITVHRSKPYAWDVLLHEYGHYIADLFSLDNSPGGSHSCSEDLIASKGKSPGSRLAWGEGLATYLGIAAQLVTNTSALGVPNAGDTSYHSLSATTGNPWQYDNETRDRCNAVGEGSETNVSRCLLDVADSAADGNDQIALGHSATWIKIRDAASHDNLSDAWNAIVQGQTTPAKIITGAAFAQNRVSPNPSAPADGAAVTMMPPTFTWQKDTLDAFEVKFYDETFNEIGASGDLGDVATYTPPQALWDTVRGAADTILWVVEGRETTAPETGTYWSGSRKLGGVDFAFVIDDTGSMTEEIGGVRQALLNFLAGFDPTSTEIIFQLSTFKDNVVVFPPTSDLATIQAEVSGLFASGGGDCPEQSAGGLAQGTLAMKRGGTVLFATDADPRPGSDLPALISQLQSLGARVNVLLSGSCSPLPITEGDSSGDVSLYSCANQCFGGSGSIDSDVTTSGNVEFSLGGIDDSAGTQGVGFTNAVDAYSQIATATAGTFAFIPEVNFSTEGAIEYLNTAENILQAAVSPRIVLVSPASIRQGASGVLTINGQSTNFLSSTTVDFGPDVTVNSVTALSPVTLAVDVQVDPAATLGFTDATAETPLSSSEFEVAFGAGVLQVLPAVADPRLVSADPAILSLGASVQVEFRGLNTNFLNGVSTVSFSSFGVTVNGVSVVAPDTLLADLTIAADAPIGFRSVSIVSNEEIAQSEVIEFLRIDAEAPPIPRVESITPAQVEAGQTVDLTIVVSELVLSPEETTVEFSGQGITVLSTTGCESAVSATIVVDPTAGPGTRDVIVRSGGQTATALNGFTVLGDSGGGDDEDGDDEDGDDEDGDDEDGDDEDGDEDGEGHFADPRVDSEASASGKTVELTSRDAAKEGASVAPRDAGLGRSAGRHPRLRSERE